jgi:hypothetical protein
VALAVVAPLPPSLNATYRVRMDSRTRTDVTAAAAAHRDLGPDYDDAVAESLVERIGAEIDKRVDTRLAQRDGPSPAQPAPPAAPSLARSGWPPVVLALGSMLAGVLATIAALHGNNDSGPGVAVAIWIVIGIINIAYASFKR